MQIHYQGLQRLGPVASKPRARSVVNMALPQHNHEARKLGPMLLAGLMTSSMLAFSAPQLALADDGEEAAPTAPLSAYERSKLEMERRRQLLREAREKAAAAQAQNAAAVEDEAPVKPIEIRRFGAPAPPEPAPAPAPPAIENKPEYKGFSFGFSKPEPAPEVAAPEPKPAPAPAPAPKPEPVKAAAKLEEVKPQSTKRRGPLPLFLAQLLVLGMFGGVVAAATKYNEQSTKLVLVAGELIKDAYKKAEQQLAK